MSFKIISDELAKLYNIKLKYISTKTDNYDNVIVYYIIKNKDFETIINDIGENVKCPWFKGEKGYIIKVKSKYINDEQKIDGKFEINLKKYLYENINGYYIDNIKFV